MVEEERDSIGIGREVRHEVDLESIALVFDVGSVVIHRVDVSLSLTPEEASQLDLGSRKVSPTSQSRSPNKQVVLPFSSAQCRICAAWKHTSPPAGPRDIA